MNTIQIIGAIQLATGKPVTEIAKQYGYSKHTFYRAINGDKYTDKARTIISAIIGKPVSEIWPDKKEKVA